MDQTNELEVLLLDSLRQLSEEFEARERHITEQYEACMTSFSEQADALRSQYNRVAQQLKLSDAQYTQVMNELTNLSESLSSFGGKSKR
jgi:hypothetical protein